MEKKKVLKRIKKPCPDCDAMHLELVLYTDIGQGVSYESEYEECDCGYSKELKLKHRNTALSLKTE
jgi:hypothetical protein